MSPLLSKPSSLDVSVLVPAYNEEQTIAACVTRAARILDGQRLQFEIIVIDDGSTDTTRMKAMEVAQNDGGHIRVLQRYVRSGKGAALIAGAEGATGSVAVVLDADMEYSPEELIPIIEPILRGQCDVVFGSRFMGPRSGMSLSHELGNRILTRATNFLYHSRLSDVMTGYKAFRLTALDRLNVDRAGFGFEVEVAAKALMAGLHIQEVPISYRRRSMGKSKIKWFDGVRCLMHLVQLKWSNRGT